MDFARIGTNVLSGKGQDYTKGTILIGWPAHMPIIAEKPLNMQVSTLYLLLIPQCRAVRRIGAGATDSSSGPMRVWTRATADPGAVAVSANQHLGAVREQPRVTAHAGVRWVWRPWPGCRPGRRRANPRPRTRWSSLCGSSRPLRPGDTCGADLYIEA